MLSISRTSIKFKINGLISIILYGIHHHSIFFRDSNVLSCGTSFYRICGLQRKLEVFVSNSCFCVHNQASSAANQVSSDDLDADNEVLNRILSAVQSSPLRTAEICRDIEKLRQAGNVSTISKLLQFLHDKRIFLNPHAYNLLLTAASEMNETEISVRVFKDLLVSSTSLSSKSYFNLAKAFSTENDTQLLKFIREVSELTFPRSALVMNRIIFAFAECRQIDRSLLIFDHMKRLKCKPDLVTYNTILGILGRAGRVDDMVREFASMKEASISPDVVSYNTLLNNLQKMGRLDLCCDYMREMDASGLEPDLRTYTALIESFGKSGNTEESLRLFNEMKRRGVKPSIYIYRSLISNFKRMGKLEASAALWEEMNSSLPNLVGPKDFKRRKS